MKIMQIECHNTAHTANGSEIVIIIIILFAFLFIGLAQVSMLTNLSP